MVYPMPFGEHMRLVRGAAGWTLRDVGAAIGVSSMYLSMVERGQKQPMSNDRILAFCDALELDPLPLIESAGLSRGFFKVPVTKSNKQTMSMAKAIVRYSRERS
jgi:transcriptional regulator with XRE-family HTH domain